MNSAFKYRYGVYLYSLAGEFLDSEFYSKKNEAINYAKTWLQREFNKFGIEYYCIVDNMLRYKTEAEIKITLNDC